MSAELIHSDLGHQGQNPRSKNLLFRGSKELSSFGFNIRILLLSTKNKPSISGFVDNKINVFFLCANLCFFF